MPNTLVYTLLDGNKILVTKEEVDKLGLEARSIPEVHPFYVDIYHPMAGWKAITYGWDDEFRGYYTPWETSPIAFLTAKEAYDWAKDWAEAEDLYLRYHSPESLEGQKSHDERTEGVMANLLKLFEKAAKNA